LLHLHPWRLSKLVTDSGLMLNCKTQSLSSWKPLSLCIHCRHVNFLLVLWSGFCKRPSSLRCNAHAHAVTVVCETITCMILCVTVPFAKCMSRCVTIMNVMQLMIWVNTAQEVITLSWTCVRVFHYSLDDLLCWVDPYHELHDINDCHTSTDAHAVHEQCNHACQVS